MTGFGLGIYAANRKRAGGGGGGGFSPASLFTGGLAGAWYDPSDLSSMFQDSAGTTPVTAAGQPVGKLNDKSGNGKHLTQATSGKRPTYQSSGGLSWLDFDGTDDALNISSTLTMTQPNDVAIALNFGTLGKVQHVFDNFDAGGRNVMFSNGGANLMMFANNAPVAATVVVSTPYVLIPRFSGATSSMRKNGVAGSTVDAGTGGMGSLSVGSLQNTGNFFQGKLYGLILRDNIFTSPELANIDTWLGAKAGLTL